MGRMLVTNRGEHLPVARLVFYVLTANLLAPRTLYVPAWARDLSSTLAWKDVPCALLELELS